MHLSQQLQWCNSQRVLLISSTQQSNAEVVVVPHLEQGFKSERHFVAMEFKA